jgi:hypothetical protein
MLGSAKNFAILQTAGMRKWACYCVSCGFIHKQKHPFFVPDVITFLVNVKIYSSS